MLCRFHSFTALLFLLALSREQKKFTFSATSFQSFVCKIPNVSLVSAERCSQRVYMYILICRHRRFLQGFLILCAPGVNCEREGVLILNSPNVWH